MSDTSPPIPLMLSPRERLAGKWQIPAAFLALVLLGVVLSRLQSPERKMGIEAHLNLLARQLDVGLYDAALERIERLLKWPDIKPSEKTTLILQRARARYDRAARNGEDSRTVAEAVLKDYDAVIKDGQPLLEKDFARIAGGYERLGEMDAAVHAYARAAAAATPPALRYRRRVIELSEFPLRIEAEKLAALLDACITNAAEEPAELLWALDRRVDALVHDGAVPEAVKLLEAHRERLTQAGRKADCDFLMALCDFGAGKADEVESRLRALLNETGEREAVHARAGWLLGRVVLGSDRAQRPEEAVAILREVIASRGDKAYVAAARVTMGEALAAVERFEDARETYKEAIADLRRMPPDRVVNADTIRVSLSAVAEQARREGRLPRATEFYELALSLVEPESPAIEAVQRQFLAEAQAAQAHMLLGGPAEGSSEAERGAHAAEGRRLLGAAGDNYMKVAKLLTRDEVRSSDAVWTAAGLYDEGGQRDRLVGLLRDFVRDHPDADEAPRVMLRLGRTLQAAGRLDEAVETLRRAVSLYPHSPLAQQALIPLAECFMSEGGKRDAEAENALKQVIDNSDLFTPDAPEYRDAMFLLSELYCRQNRYEEALPVLEETLANYPDDPRTAEAMFLTANAYRQSAMGIKEDLEKPEFLGESKRLRADMTQRLQEAARRFRSLTERLEARPDIELSAIERLYLQDARLYEAACLFEQQRYADALALYERAAWIYKDSPVALGAYVQVINCYVFLGRQEEAETALRRAQYLVETIGEDRFTDEGGAQTRTHWRKYFAWVADIIKDAATG